MLFVDDAFFYVTRTLPMSIQAKGEERERGMDTGKTSDDEKRQDASIPDSVICFTMMYTLRRQNKDSLCAFFF
jgi:hypothetical protein